MKYRMIVTVVPRGGGERVAAAAVRAGAGGGTVLLGKGSAPSAILQFLGLGETAKDVTLSLVGADVARAAMDAIVAEASRDGVRGVVFSAGVCAFARGGVAGDDVEGKDAGEMEGEGDYRLVTAIVNKGYAEDAMAAARRAGASGGTVLQARGTAREDDAKFFGVRLVPEKELLLIVVETARAGAVFDAIRGLPCLAEKGSGVVFVLPASDFAPLGEKR